MKRHRRGGALMRIGVLRATRRILEPLARAAVREGITADEFAVVAREALTASRSRRRGSGERANAVAPSPVDFEVALRLAGRWLGEARYARNGRPHALPIRGSGSFNELASRVGADPEIMLADMLRVGAVRVDRRGRVVLQEEGYVPSRGVAEKLDILGRDGAEFVATILHNLRARSGQTRLQRRASYDNIGSAALPSLQRRLRALAMDALRSTNQALAGVDRDRNTRAPGGSRTRVSLGIYIAQERVAGSDKTSAVRKRVAHRGTRGHR